MFVSFIFFMFLALWYLRQEPTVEYPQWTHFLGAFLTGLISYFSLGTVIAIGVEEVIELRQEREKRLLDKTKVVSPEDDSPNSEVPSRKYGSE